MKSVAEDIKDMLVADTSLKLIFAKNLFIGMPPPSVTQSVTVIDTTGRGPDLTLNENEYRYEGVQVRIKGYKYDVQYELANKIINSLHKRANETWNGSLYILINVIDTPALLEWEVDGRVHLIFNIKTQRKV